MIRFASRLFDDTLAIDVQAACDKIGNRLRQQLMLYFEYTRGNVIRRIVVQKSAQRLAR